VLTHAVCEALLGSLALGDLGRLFPDTDPRYKGASSLGLLRSVMELLSSKGARVVTVDATVICQAPRLASFLPEMARQLAQAMALAPDGVSVKAKSPEHLGLLGRGEGIASMAVVSVEAP
jgi:2-C-methyl-D-erythritol 2,4-cyclodiphosphate synthase